MALVSYLQIARKIRIVILDKRLNRLEIRQFLARKLPLHHQPPDPRTQYCCPHSGNRYVISVSHLFPHNANSVQNIRENYKAFPQHGI